MTEAGHQGRRRADGHRRRDDPHVGAALRLPRAGADRRRLPPLHRRRRRGAAPRRRATAARPVGPRARSTARARRGGRDRPPSIFGAVAAADAPARPQVLRKRTLIALSRAIEHETLARAAAPVVFGGLPGGAQLPRGRAPLPPAGPRRPTRSAVFADFAEPRARTRRAGRDPDRGRRRARQRVGGGGRRARLRRLPLAGWERPTQDAETADADRRFEAVWTMDPPSSAAPRRSRARSRRAAARPGRAARRCWPTARWRWSHPRRG